MPSTEITSEQAYELAKTHRELAVEIGKYRFANWNTMIPEDRQKLKDFESTLLMQSEDFNQKSVTLLLTAPETQQAVANVVKTTKDLKEAVKTLQGINKILGVAAAAFKLGIAVFSGRPNAILDAIAEAVSAINA